MGATIASWFTTNAMRLAIYASLAVVTVAVVAMVLSGARKRGRAEQLADTLTATLERLDEAQHARDDSRRDPDERERLRDKYRSR